MQAILLFVAVLSLVHILVINFWTQTVADHSVCFSLGGALLSGSLLWLSMLAGAASVSALGMGGGLSTIVAASLITLTFFILATIFENMLAVAIHFIISGYRDAAPKVACMIHTKYAGLFRRA